MARVHHQPLDVHARHAEGRLRLAPAGVVSSRQLGRRLHGAHAAPAAAADGLDDDANLLPIPLLRAPEGLGLVERDLVLRARHQRYAAARRQRARLGLVAEQRELHRRGADEAHASIGAGGREVGALAQEAVARVHGFHAALARQGDEPHTVKVSRRARGAQRDGLGGRLHMRRTGIVVGVHRDTGNAQVVQGTRDAQRHLAPVGDQDFGKERRVHGFASFLIAASALCISARSRFRL